MCALAKKTEIEPDYFEECLNEMYEDEDEDDPDFSSSYDNVCFEDEYQID